MTITPKSPEEILLRYEGFSGIDGYYTSPEELKGFLASAIMWAAEEEKVFHVDKPLLTDWSDEAAVEQYGKDCFSAALDQYKASLKALAEKI